ncbi:MAG: alpha-ketoacid dehydrogenase subunit beta [Rhodospirillales bacterium]
MSETANERANRTVPSVIAAAIGHEMAADPAVLALGEDVGRLGGVFGATKGLQERFGAERVFDTPIAEMAFTGMGVGLAMSGFRPIVEIMFVDFVGVCLEQVFNAAAKIPLMSGGRQKMPIVFKTAGGCIGSAAQHSQCLWGLFAHLPGLKVVAPCSPRDHAGLMASAIQSDDPVVFIEHKALLLRKLKEFRHNPDVPDSRFAIPLGRAEIVRPGRDVTLATLSASVEYALEAAEIVAAEGIDVEVVDLRTVVPLDVDTVAASAARTGRLLVVDEDYLSFGLSAELAMRVLEKLGPSALRQISRLAVPDIAIPAALSLEQEIVPGATAIAARLRRMSGGA